MSLRMKLIAGAVAGALFAISGTTAVMAQDVPAKIDDKDKAAAAIKARADFMTGMGANEKLLISVMKGEAPLDAKAITAAEQNLASVKTLTMHFAPGTGDDAVPGSRARASIWKEWDKYKQLSSAVIAPATATLAAAKAGNQAAFAEQQQATSAACSACHKEYPAPRQR